MSHYHANTPNVVTASKVARLLRMSAQNVVTLANLGQIPVAVTLSTGERLFDADALKRRDRTERRIQL
jgi:hypothetical protein